ncbi:signal peptidase I [Oceanobacillus sp. CAU 1775]
MKNLKDNEFKRLNNAVSLSNESKDKIKENILNGKVKRHNNFVPKLLSAFITIIAIGLVFLLIIDPLTDSKEISLGELIDNTTPEALPKVEVSDNLYTIEWLSDSMDRGNHDLKTNIHGELVISRDIETIERGNILYYHFDEDKHIGRVVGLPGETVEIREGQVYIDNKALNTFYGIATSLGLNKEEYFDRVTSENVDIKGMEAYFNTSMEPIKVEENTYFVLVDMWWRGTDSRDIGLISFNQIEGMIIGYEK